jgi:hypothetical protein
MVLAWSHLFSSTSSVCRYHFRRLSYGGLPPASTMSAVQSLQQGFQHVLQLAEERRRQSGLTGLDTIATATVTAIEGETTAGTGTDVL